MLRNSAEKLILRNGRGPLAYVFRGSASTGGTGLSLSGTIDLGPASPGRLVVVAIASQGGVAGASVVVNGVSLNPDINPGSAGIFSGMVPGSGPQNVTVTWASGTFNQRGFGVWTVTGLVSKVVKQKINFGSPTGNIVVDGGDLMFCATQYANTGPPNFGTTTQAPFGNREIFTNGSTLAGAATDWTIASSNAAFTVGPNISSLGATSVATYR
jgi:hypothetical protein